MGKKGIRKESSGPSISNRKVSINQMGGSGKLASVFEEGCDMIKSVLRQKYSYTGGKSYTGGEQP